MFTIIERLTKLIEAIQALSISSSSTSRANATGCGCPGGSDPPSEPGTEGETPPDGWEDSGLVGNDYTSRKCIIANLVHQFIIDVITRLNIAGVDGLISAISVGGVGLGVAWVVSVLSGIAFGWVLLVIGAVAIIAETIVQESIDFDGLIVILNNNEEELVCSLFSATSTSEARLNYIDIVENNGGQTGQIAFLNVLLQFDDVLNSLFFDPLTERAAQLQASIDAYSGGVNCSGCGCGAFSILVGSLVSGELDGDEFVIASGTGSPSTTDMVAGYVPAGCCMQFDYQYSSGPNNSDRKSVV